MLWSLCVATEWMQTYLQETAVIVQERDDGGWTKVVAVRAESSRYFGGEAG